MRLWGSFITLLANGVLVLTFFFWASGKDMSDFLLSGEVIASAFMRGSIKRIPAEFSKSMWYGKSTHETVFNLKKKKKKRKDVLWNQTPEASDSFLIALLILLVQVCATSFQMFSSHGGRVFKVANFQISHPCISQLCGYLYISPCL